MFSNLAGVVETISRFFEGLVSRGYLTIDYIFYVSLALELVLIVFFLIKSSYSYELRLDRALDGLNRWLYYNQYLDEANLIEFNNRIKKAPKLLRYHWQQYMLYREKDPSHYMSAYNCIEKPLHTSSFSSNIKNLVTICYTMAALTFVLNLSSFTGQGELGFVLLNSLITPVVIVVFSTFFTILLRSWQNSNLAGLYQNFHLFSRYIDKAATTLPEYIDFEVLFTKEEIKRGIPVLNEFLEKRARQEQKELENAMLNSVDHEEYDFSELGISGSQIVERAMRETEIFLNQRQRVLAEIQQLESEIESAKRNYENNQKEYQRKMQTSKENVERLRKQQEESTNRIESNYIRKQQTDEIRKQEQLEKDYESITLRFNQDINSLAAEIKTRRDELAEKKLAVEEAMHAEYETFSSRVYKELKQYALDKEKEEREQLIAEKENYLTLLQQTNQLLSEKEKEVKKLQDIIANNNINLGDYGEFYDEKLRKEAKQRKHKSLNLKTPEPVAIEPEATPVQEVVAEPAPVVAPVATPTEPEYDEYGGYYDSEGYYRYKNGTYYDPQGNFHDEKGGYYDTNGNYFPPQEEIEETPAPQVANPLYDEFEGFYDAEGNYRYKNGSYYDAWGNFHDVNEQVKPEPVVEVKPEQIVEAKPEEVKTVVAEVKPVKAVEEKPKRGRGRPKKEVKEVVEEEPKATGRRGRPRKEQTVVEESETEVKRRRGRPRKDEAPVEVVKVQEAPKTSGKRGRPKKEEKSDEKQRAKRGKSLKKRAPKLKKEEVVPQKKVTI